MPSRALVIIGCCGLGGVGEAALVPVPADADEDAVLFHGVVQSAAGLGDGVQLLRAVVSRPTEIWVGVLCPAERSAAVAAVSAVVAVAAVAAGCLKTLTWNGTASTVSPKYSVLSSDVPWEPEDVWRTFAGYLLILHIPLSFGGLGVVAKVLHCSSLDSLTTVVSTAMLQLGELALGLALLQYTAKPGRQVGDFFAGKFSSRRGWIKETVLWLGLLMSVVFLTSLIADSLIGPEDAYDPILKEILSDGGASRLVCWFLYCLIAPLSEEIIYRGFLLTALSSSMKWRNAVVARISPHRICHIINLID
ncbi:hypothetical protein D1007_45623 [Hordeum vulgare]|nr:hypothetical protein D1007_45623 [Hordeum vulgare]